MESGKTSELQRRPSSFFLNRQWFTFSRIPDTTTSKTKIPNAKSSPSNKKRPIWPSVIPQSMQVASIAQEHRKNLTAPPLSGRRDPGPALKPIGESYTSLNHCRTYEPPHVFTSRSPPHQFLSTDKRDRTSIWIPFPMISNPISNEEERSRGSFLDNRDIETLDVGIRAKPTKPRKTCDARICLGSLRHAC